MVKKVSFVTHESPSFDEEARIRSRHLGLSQDYLELQKEFLTKKKKFRAVERRRKILMAEVRFLSQRHAHLLKIRASETETASFKHQNPNVQPKNSANERNGFNANCEFKSNGGVKPIGEIVRIQKKPGNGSMKRKTVGKKKLPVPDQAVLEV